MAELCAWCKRTEVIHYARYNGCCSLHCRDLMECDQEITKRDKRIVALEGVVKAAKDYNEFMLDYRGRENDLKTMERMAQQANLFGKLSLELSKLEEV